MPSQQIWTIGHSNHEWEQFLAMLEGASIECVADVRRFPGSRRQPQFQQDNLQQALTESGMGYVHFADLGGRRSGRMVDSPNGAWRVESFNTYADYMLSESFQTALCALQETARKKKTAILCAEAVPWRCHRRLIADALLVRGWTVWDIFTPTRVQEHALTPFAVVEGDRVIYPDPESDRPPS